VSTRNTAGYRDPAVIAIDQMKEIYIDGSDIERGRESGLEAGHEKRLTRPASG
jgi:hypothetical protein